MTDAQVIKSMMDKWDQIMAITRAEHPDATEEVIYQTAKAAMHRLLKLDHTNPNPNPTRRTP